MQEIINPVGKAEREYGRGTTVNSNHTCELQDEVAFYMSQCCEQREELIQVKEKLKLFEEENEDLQAEVGRQYCFYRAKKGASEIFVSPPVNMQVERVSLVELQVLGIALHVQMLNYLMVQV